MIISENKQVSILAKKNNVAILNPMKYRGTLYYFFLAFFRKFRLKDIFLYNKFPQTEPQCIIVFDSLISKYYLRALKKNYPKARIIFWYWNDVRYTLPPDKIPNGIEKWSYSEQDCQKYNLKFNTQFFLREKEENSMPVTKDIIYVGRDKNRRKDLIFYETLFKKKGLNVDFHVVANRNHFVFKNKRYYKAPISYTEVLQKVQSSKAVFDFYEDEAMGLSLRPFEALVYQKKLITNNKNISSYDFYHPNNIFILGKDDLSELEHFLQLPFIDTTAVIEKYSFESWIQRF